MPTEHPEGDTPDTRDAPSADQAEHEAQPAPDLEALLARDPDSEEAWLRIAAMARDPELARAIYRRVLAGHPESQRAQQALAALDRSGATPDDEPEVAKQPSPPAPDGDATDRPLEVVRRAAHSPAVIPARDAPEPPMAAAPTQTGGLEPLKPLKPPRQPAWPGLRIFRDSVMLAMLLFVLLGVGALALVEFGGEGAYPLRLVMGPWATHQGTPTPTQEPTATETVATSAPVASVDAPTPTGAPTRTSAPATATPTSPATHTPTPTSAEPTETPTEAPTDTPTADATGTPSPTATSAPTETVAPTATSTPTNTAVSTETAAPEATPEPTLSELVIPSWATDRYLPLPVDEKWIEVNLTTQEIIAYEGMEPVFSTIVSSGKANTPTMVGKFRIQLKYESQLMRGPGYYLPNVPWVMYYYGNYAIHGAYWHTNWGTPMSHGCVNLPIEDAEWLFHWADPPMPEDKRTVVSSADNPGTWVLVHK